jgi:hypothetical protein
LGVCNGQITSGDVQILIRSQAIFGQADSSVKYQFGKCYAGLGQRHVCTHSVCRRLQCGVVKFCQQLADCYPVTDFDRSQFALHPVRVETWGCLLFVGLDRIPNGDPNDTDDSYGSGVNPLPWVSPSDPRG